MRARNHARLFALFAGWALVFVPGSASSAIETQADAAIQLYCSDADGSAHPKKIKLLQLLSGADVEALQDGRLLAGYERDGDDEGEAKIKATVRQKPVAGGSKKLGKITFTMNRVTGEALGAKEVGFEAETGDTVLWTFKFQKTRPLEAGQCITLFAGVTRPAEGCGPYPAPSTSKYSMPFRPGLESVMSQGNCSGIGSHRYAGRHAYDFALPMGTELLAIEGGVVQDVIDQSPDGTGLGRDGNFVHVRHDDGTYVTYFHIAQGSALVGTGARIEQGQPIASSGNSGGTGGIPHLHLQLTSCGQRSVCGTLPITFNNTSVHPNGLEVGKLYRAR